MHFFFLSPSSVLSPLLSFIVSKAANFGVISMHIVMKGGQLPPAYHDYPGSSSNSNAFLCISNKNVLYSSTHSSHCVMVV